MFEHRNTSAKAKTDRGKRGAPPESDEPAAPPLEQAPAPATEAPSRSSQSQRASELWKLLATDPEDRPGPSSAPVGGAAVGADPGTGVQPPHWAGNEMGELLARAWDEASPSQPSGGPQEGGGGSERADSTQKEVPAGAAPSPAVPSALAAAAPLSSSSPSMASLASGVADSSSASPTSEVAEAWNEPAAWVVDPIPSAAEGGVLAMFTTGARAKESASAPWSPDGEGLAEHSDRDRLVDMLDNLPGPLPRVGAGDITVDGVAVSPVTVWLWGDDDIYPGRVRGLGVSKEAAVQAPSRQRGRFGR